MPRIVENRDLKWSAEQMYDLVADVRRYAEFLPWVVGTRIKSDSEEEMIADLLVGFSALREKFTSRVLKTRPSQIRVEYIDGPLKRLENDWTFTPKADGGCTIGFSVDFTFRNAIFEKIAGQYLDAAFRKMVAAFEKRAEQLYGSNSSSAVSVA
ncbi:MAG: ubiquinone-binding protein [Novosphingobium sp. 17-62-19]|uniref:type II toxin-antitoxin system RatA family toxin n=1 Tax=Novosphingobium sp. 17-62-19 TaxID=1970406 RepID=UPI000BDD4657|nr:type II toxin-antitoxin system RatA family toxin [Novosphingobium sp. 17-62-19]OZA17899.1 MAG: ubiquinone-binding protein [Novosphingobium sp. 17-62-19]HQS97877.1 type II toxin-antitoxin system RatA family toxin [Novosphingobium sp.]